MAWNSSISFRRRRVISESSLSAAYQLSGRLSSGDNCFAWLSSSSDLTPRVIISKKRRRNEAFKTLPQLISDFQTEFICKLVASSPRVRSCLRSSTLNRCLGFQPRPCFDTSLITLMNSDSGIPSRTMTSASLFSEASYLLLSFSLSVSYDLERIDFNSNPSFLLHNSLSNESSFMTHDNV